MKDAGDRVRSELYRPRLRAFDAGISYQFRYEPNGRRFVAVPAEREIVASPDQAASPAAGTLPVMAGEITEGLTFRPDPGTPPVGELLAADWLAGLPNAGDLQQVQWSPPVFFRPDGTGTTIRFRITDEEQRFIEISVRELTGVATAGPLRKDTTSWD